MKSHMMFEYGSVRSKHGALPVLLWLRGMYYWYPCITKFDFSHCRGRRASVAFVQMEVLPVYSAEETEGMV